VIPLPELHIPYDEQGNRKRLAQLSERGVITCGPERVYIGEDVQLERISPGAVLVHATITGSNTFVGSAAQIGASGFCRINDAQIGAKVELGPGTYENCVLLEAVKVRGFAELRYGTVLEEEAELGHNVGLKNTVFTAGAVAGSLINFCDVVMTGGSSRRDHSEVGSGTVHFNFDPRGDKFGSLLGDATGCLLRSSRIFVGGNAGLVAPVHVGFGAVVAAGSIVRNDIADNQLSFGDAPRPCGDFDPERYFDLSRKFIRTSKLIGTLHALRAWYQQVRQLHASSGDRPLYASAEAEFDSHIRHRTSELTKIISKLNRSMSRPFHNATDALWYTQHRTLIQNSNRMVEFLLREEYEEVPKNFIASYDSLRSKWNYRDSLRLMEEDVCNDAADWLRRVAVRPEAEMKGLFDKDFGALR
jgi:acetyltransferase-like isoleucine patch superfamily enzyme